uniref:Uncharacterized protein n=1 Tax=Cucumis melo TaxID=3656 RepID=A0A9I9CBV0_CUCME
LTRLNWHKKRTAELGGRAKTTKTGRRGLAFSYDSNFDEMARLACFMRRHTAQALTKTDDEACGVLLIGRWNRTA